MISKKILLSVKILFFSSWLFAQTNYYVDFSNGNDTNPGTETQPWKTIAKVNGFSFSPGDHIKFKRNETWNEYLYASSSGNASSGHIVYETYGTGSEPMLAHSDYGILIDGQDYIIVRDFEITSANGVMIYDSEGSNPPDHIEVLNNKMHGNSIPPAYTSDGGVNIRHGANNIVVSGNEIYNHYYPVWLGEGAGCQTIITNNTIYDCSGAGIGSDEVHCSEGTENVFSYNEIYNVDWHGIELAGNWHIVEHNVIHNSGSGGHSGIHLFARFEPTDPDKGGDYNVIRYNKCFQIYDRTDPNYRTDGNGIQIDQWCDYNLVYNNITYENDGAGIIIFGGSGNKIYNNTMYNNGLDLGNRYGQFEFLLAQDDDSPCNDNIVANNIGFASSENHFAAATDEVSQNNNNTFSSNLWFNSAGDNMVGIIEYDLHAANPVSQTDWNNFSWTTNEIFGDPLFTNQTTNDFHLQSNSPAIDAGTDLSSEGITDDYDGVARPQGNNYDSGAYEYDDITPVELISFSANINENNSVTLCWITATEVNNYGFKIEKKELNSADENFQNQNWKTIGFISGSGNSSSPSKYSFIDCDIDGGKISYRLKQIDTDGSFGIFDSVVVEIEIPFKFKLLQNYPNPFNPETIIKYQLASKSRVEIIVFDILGRKVATLVDKEQSAGYHQIIFGGSNLASGIYLVSMKAANFHKSIKAVLLR